jgi:glycosyltransferase involved in cell wall biosynthesis
VVVANPGAVSWMVESARAFAEVGRLAAYVAPVAVSDADLARVRALPLPGPLTRRVESELVRRRVDEAVSPRVRRAGTAYELAHVGLMRLPLPLRARRAMFRPRMLAFDRAVGRVLDGDTGAVIAYQGAARATLRRARELGAGAVLDYPIAHPQTVERVLGEERRRVPDYASSIPPYPAWLLGRYADEIATADRIVVLSSYARATFADAGVDATRLCVAPLGVDPEVFTPAPAPPDGPLRVAFCGQITQRKGLSYLVEGFARAGLPGAELLVIGPPVGPATPWIGRPGVRHVPAVPRSALPGLLGTCHAIALPSLIEGFGAAALEGMACGLPAIVTPHTFADDVVSDGVDGWIVPIRDAGAIAERLRLLDRDRDRQARMAAAARATAERFPWARYREALRAGVAGLLPPAGAP